MTTTHHHHWSTPIDTTPNPIAIGRITITGPGRLHLQPFDAVPIVASGLTGVLPVLNKVPA